MDGCYWNVNQLISGGVEFIAVKDRENMNALYLQILVGVGVMLIIVIGFILTVKSGQYDDLDSPAHRILMDDDDPRIPANNKPKDNP